MVCNMILLVPMMITATSTIQTSSLCICKKSPAHQNITKSTVFHRPVHGLQPWGCLLSGQEAHTYYLRQLNENVNRMMQSRGYSLAQHSADVCTKSPDLGVYLTLREPRFKAVSYNSIWSKNNQLQHVFFVLHTANQDEILSARDDQLVCTSSKPTMLHCSLGATKTALKTTDVEALLKEFESVVTNQQHRDELHGSGQHVNYNIILVTNFRIPVLTTIKNPLQSKQNTTVYWDILKANDLLYNREQIPATGEISHLLANQKTYLKAYNIKACQLPTLLPTDPYVQYMDLQSGVVVCRDNLRTNGPLTGLRYLQSKECQHTNPCKFDYYKPTQKQQTHFRAVAWDYVKKTHA